MRETWELRPLLVITKDLPSQVEGLRHLSG
jgi:hypothetical protein